MKKITLIIYLIFGSYLAIYAQNERNLKTATLAWDTTYIVDSISDIVMGNDGIGYSDNNSILFEMDINSFLKKADSIFIGYDSFPDEGVFKEATIYSVSSRIKEMYLWSMAFQKSNDMLYVEYISYLDDKGFVHEFFNTPENQVVLKKFIDLFTTPEKYPNARILD